MPGPVAVRELPRRSPGSRTKPWERSLPWGVYHGSQAAWWLLHRNWRLVLVAAWFAGIWWLTQDLRLVVPIGCVTTGGCWYAWLRWRYSRAEGAADSFRETLRQRRRMRTLTERWDLAWESAKLLGTRSGQPPRRRKVRAEGNGTISVLVHHGPIGITSSSLQPKLGTLAEVIGCREAVRVPVSPGTSRIQFHWLDPLSRTLPLVDLPPARKGHIAYGVRFDGTAATIKLHLSVLIGGLTGMGKSNIIWALLADLQRQNIPVDLCISDPKGGIELDAFEQMLGKKTGGLVRVRHYATTAQATMDMLDATEKAMRLRLSIMKRQGLRFVKFDQDNPLVVTILDETLTLSDLVRGGTSTSGGKIAYEGRASGYVIWALAQAAQIDVIGRFRDLIPQRICLATGSSDVTDSILGKGSEAAGAKCSEITTPGIGYSFVEGDIRPQRFRGALVTDSETKQIAVGRLPQPVLERAVTIYKDQSQPRRAPKDPNRETTLYRWFDPNGPEPDRPQYIGIGFDALARASQHIAGLREFAELEEIRWTQRKYPTRDEAEAAEAAAIRAERPVHNIQHNEAVTGAQQ